MDKGYRDEMLREYHINGDRPQEFRSACARAGSKYLGARSARDIQPTAGMNRPTDHVSLMNYC